LKGVEKRSNWGRIPTKSNNNDWGRELKLGGHFEIAEYGKTAQPLWEDIILQFTDFSQERGREGGKI